LASAELGLMIKKEKKRKNKDTKLEEGEGFKQFFHWK